MSAITRNSLKSLIREGMKELKEFHSYERPRNDLRFNEDDSELTEEERSVMKWESFKDTLEEHDEFYIHILKLLCHRKDIFMSLLDAVNDTIDLQDDLFMAMKKADRDDEKFTA